MTGTAVLHEDDAIDSALREAIQVQAVLCRLDLGEFCRFVLEDDSTGKPIVPAPMHERWYEIWTSHERVVMWGHVESGKTTQLVGLILFTLGQNPRARIGIVSSTGHTSGMAYRILRATKRYIEESDALHLVFPDLVPGDPWSVEALYCKGSGGLHPSIKAFGVEGDMLGSRFDLLIWDDGLDWRNTLTELRRQRVTGWWKATALGRVVKGGIIIMIGNAWHERDTMHQMEAEGWPSFRFPVRDPETGEISWPGQWDDERVAFKEREFGPLDSARALYCRPRSEEDIRFKAGWLTQCMRRGDGLEFVDSSQSFPRGTRFVVGVDLGVGRKARKRKKGLTVFTALAELPNGDIRIACIESGNWLAPTIILKAQDYERRYGAVVYVEDVAAQRYILEIIDLLDSFVSDALRQSSAVHELGDIDEDDLRRIAASLRRHGRPKIFGFTTGMNKHDPELGVEALVSTSLATARMIIPSTFVTLSDEDGVQREVEKLHPEIERLIADMRTFHPEAHTGDHLMSLWIGLEGLQRGRGRFVHRTGTVGDVVEHADARRDRLSAAGPGTTVEVRREKTRITAQDVAEAARRNLWAGLGIGDVYDDDDVVVELGAEDLDDLTEDDLDYGGDDE